MHRTAKSGHDKAGAARLERVRHCHCQLKSDCEAQYWRADRDGVGRCQMSERILADGVPSCGSRRPRRCRKPLHRSSNMHCIAGLPVAYEPQAPADARRGPTRTTLFDNRAEGAR
jgi:hypothetical protein